METTDVVSMQATTNTGYLDDCVLIVDGLRVGANRAVCFPNFLAC